MSCFRSAQLARSLIVLGGIMGSVKDLFIKRPVGEESLGEGYFSFSDRYSVFDWGEMPDKIRGKGASLSMMAAFNFELLEEKGLDTHYLGLREDGEVRSLNQLKDSSSKMEIQLARIPDVEFDDRGYKYEDLRNKKNYVIPLEVVFRNSVPVGSSIRDRYEPIDLVYDFDCWPDEELDLGDPLVEFSTKYEEKDRYLEDGEAEEISGLAGSEFEELKSKAFEVNEIITDQAEKRGFKHLDGKIECVYAGNKILVADVVGTFDENRFSYEGVNLSKEFLRQWYRREDESWHQEVVEAQKKARRQGIDRWKELVKEEPKDLPPEVLDRAQNLYKAGANYWIGENVFEALDLDQVIEEM